jgi:hypothetical protein
MSMLAELTLLSTRQLSFIWHPDTPSFSQMIPSAVCALGLARTALKCCGQLPDSGGLSPNHTPSAKAAHRASFLSVVQQLHGQAHDYVLEIVVQISMSSAPDRLQQLLASPHLMPCVATTCALMALIHPMQRKAAAAAAHSKCDGAAASSGSSNSSKSSSDGGGADLAVSQDQQPKELLTAGEPPVPKTAAPSPDFDHNNSWDLAGQLVKKVSTCQRQLFQVLGVDAQTMLWFVLSIDNPSREFTPWPIVSDSLPAATNLLVVRMHKHIQTNDTNSPPSKLQTMPQAQRQLESKLLLLLPTVLLPCAVASGSNVAAVTEAIALCMTALHALGVASSELHHCCHSTVATTAADQTLNSSNELTVPATVRLESASLLSSPH